MERQREWRQQPRRRRDRENYDTCSPSARSREPPRRMASARSGLPSRSYRNPNPNPNRPIPPSYRFPDSGRRRNPDRTQLSRRRSVSNDPNYDEGCFSDELSYRDRRSHRKDSRPTFLSSEGEEKNFYDARSHFPSRNRSFTRNDNKRADRERHRRTADSRHDSRYNDDDTQSHSRRDTRSYADVVAGRYRDRSAEGRNADHSANRSDDRRQAERPDYKRRDDRRRDDRRTGRTRDRRTDDRRNNSSDRRHTDYPPRAPAPSAKFAQLSRIFFNIIKICHHLENVTTTHGNKGPLTIRRTVDFLCDLIRPAMPNSTTMLSLEGNARQWGVVALDTLEQHYTECLTVLMDELSNKDLRNWRAPFKVATRWALRKFTRLRQSTIEQAEGYIQSQARDTSSSEEDEEDNPPGPPSSTSASSSPSPSPPPPPPPPPKRPRPHRATAAAKSASDNPPPPPVQSAPTSSKPLKHRIKTIDLPTTSHSTGALLHTESQQHKHSLKPPPKQKQKKIFPIFLPTTVPSVTHPATSVSPSDSADTIRSDPISSFPSPPREEVPHTAVSEPLPQRYRRHRLEFDSSTADHPDTIEETQFEEPPIVTVHRPFSPEDDTPLEPEGLNESQESELNESDNDTDSEDAEADFAEASDNPLFPSTDSGDSPLPAHQPSSSFRGKVNMHLTTKRKMSDWSLTIYKKNPAYW